MEKYKVSVVNYLNSAPFVQGIQNATDLPVELVLDHPSESARKLISGEVQIALAPVAILKDLLQFEIISDYCIGTTGEVKTVKVFSERSIDKVSRILLDYQSRTSFELVKILCRQHWHIQPDLQPAYTGFQKDIWGSTAGLIIGDRTIRALGKYPFEYDLGMEWKAMTNLPFVFAAWISLEPIDPAWTVQFNAALSVGLSRRQEVIRQYNHLNTEHFNVNEYLTQSISYSLDAEKRQAMEMYLRLIM